MSQVRKDPLHASLMHKLLNHCDLGLHDAGHPAGRLHAGAELQSGTELHEGLPPGRIAHSGIKQALHMLECYVCSN